MCKIVANHELNCQRSWTLVHPKSPRNWINPLQQKLQFDILEFGSNSTAIFGPFILMSI